MKEILIIGMGHKLNEPKKRKKKKRANPSTPADLSLDEIRIKTSQVKSMPKSAMAAPEASLAHLFCLEPKYTSHPR